MTDPPNDPIICPFCGMRVVCVNTITVELTSSDNDDTDGYPSVLDEYRCRVCDRSFWV
jgi:hypothetical protein